MVIKKHVKYEKNVGPQAPDSRFQRYIGVSADSAPGIAFVAVVSIVVFVVFISVVVGIVKLWQTLELHFFISKIYS